MSYDELELDKLGDEKSALFFLISDTDTTYNFLVALAFSQMLVVNQLRNICPHSGEKKKTADGQRISCAFLYH